MKIYTTRSGLPVRIDRKIFLDGCLVLSGYILSGSQKITCTWDADGYFKDPEHPCELDVIQKELKEVTE